MTKDEILERYLNTVYLGNGAYGVQAGAETYFDKGVAELNIGQSAFLAGMIANPTRFDPVRNPEASKARRELALQRLVAVGLLTAATRRAYIADGAAADRDQPVQPRDAGLLRRGGEAGPLRRPAPRRHPRGAPEPGLPRRSADLHDPRPAGAAARHRLPQRGAGRGRRRRARRRALVPLAPDPVTGTPRSATGAVVSIEPGTGAVRAMVGGAGLRQRQVQHHHPGPAAPAARPSRSSCSWPCSRTATSRPTA